MRQGHGKVYSYKNINVIFKIFPLINISKFVTLIFNKNLKFEIYLIIIQSDV